MQHFFHLFGKLRSFLTFAIIVLNALIISCSTTAEKPALDSRIKKLEDDFNNGYTARVERDAQALAPLLPKGSLVRAKVLEYYGEALAQNGKMQESARVFAQLFDENPLSDRRREWLFKSAQNYYASRKRVNVDPKPLSLALEQLEKIKKAYGPLTDAEKELEQAIKRRLAEYYSNIARFYDQKGHTVAAERYRLKIRELEVQ